jgi:hypothetical protein
MLAQSDLENPMGEVCRFIGSAATSARPHTKFAPKNVSKQKLNHTKLVDLDLTDDVKFICFDRTFSESKLIFASELGTQRNGSG